MHGMSVDLPYPSTDGLRPDAESVKILSPAYADRGSELTAILQYVYHSIVFAGLNRKQYARMMVEIAIAEMHHLDLLGGMLYNLGALPVFTSCPPRLFDFYSAAAVSFSCVPQKMLMDDIRGETEAIRGYEAMLCRLKNERVAAVIERILLDEKLHLETLKGMLREETQGGKD